MNSPPRTSRSAPLPQEISEGPVATTFGRAAAQYQAHADIQRVAAGRVIERLTAERHSLPEGPVLEVGCGTGFISGALCRLFPDRRIHLTDRSGAMVRFCHGRLPEHGAVEAYRANGERWPRGSERFALIVAGFVAQWFDDPAGGLRRLSRALLPGGMLIASVPGSGSFPEWKRACLAAGVRCTARPLPAASILIQRVASATRSATVTEEAITELHEGPLHFFRHLRRIGAGAQPAGPPLSAPDMRRLLRSWTPGPTGCTEVTYQLLVLTMRSAQDLP